MDTTPAWLAVVVQNKQRYTIPVNAAGMQVGPAVLFRNPNRQKRGGYGPGAVDAPSPLSAVSASTDEGDTSTSGNTTPHRRSRCCRQSSVCFTDAPTDKVDYGDFLQIPMVAVTAAAAPQPSILRKSSSFPRALPPLFDFEYEPPHTPQQPLAEAEINVAVDSVSFNGDEKSAKGTKQANGHARRSRLSSAAAVSCHFSLSSPSTHHPLRKGSDSSLRFVMGRAMGNTATVSRAVHQLPMPEGKVTEHLPSEVSEAAAEAVPSTPTRSPFYAFGAPPMKAATPEAPYGALYTLHGGVTPELEVYADEAGEAASTGQKCAKQLTGPPRTVREGGTRMPRTPHVLPFAAEEDEVGQITSDLAQGTYTIYGMPSLSRLSPMRSADASGGDGCDVNRLLMQDKAGVREPRHQEEEAVGIEFRMDGYFFARQTSSPDSEVRSISQLGNDDETRRNVPSGACEECIESSNLVRSLSPHIEGKAIPWPPQGSTVTRGTLEEVSPSLTDASDAEYEYVNPSTPIAVRLFSVSPSLRVEGFSRASLCRGQHAAAHALTPREVGNSVGMWGRHTVLTLVRRFAYTSQLRPMPSIPPEEPKVGCNFPSGMYGESTVSKSPRSAVAPASLTTVPPRRERRSEMADLRSISMSDYEAFHSAESVTLSSSETILSSTQPSSEFEDQQPSRWSLIRERLARPLIPVSPASEERRLPSLLQRYRATIKAKARHFAQSRSSSNQSATLDPLCMRRRSKIVK